MSAAGHSGASPVSLAGPPVPPKVTEKQIVEARFGNGDALSAVLARIAYLEARTAALEAALPETLRLLGCVHVKDCGDHYCRYCSARSPEWNHEAYCAYGQSQRDHTAASMLTARLLALRPSETKTRETPNG